MSITTFSTSRSAFSSSSAPMISISSPRRLFTKEKSSLRVFKPGTRKISRWKQVSSWKGYRLSAKSRTVMGRTKWGTSFSPYGEVTMPEA